MPLQLWIVLAALAVAAPSFAKDAAPKGAVHGWSEKAEPSVVPVGEPEMLPRSAFAADFPDIAPAPAPALQEKAPVRPAPAAEAPAVVEVAEPKPAALVAAVAETALPAVAETAKPAAAEIEKTAAAGIAKTAASLVEAPAAVVESPEAEAVVEPVALPEPTVLVEEEAPKPAAAPRPRPVQVVRPRSGEAEKAAARAYIASLQAQRADSVVELAPRASAMIEPAPRGAAVETVPVAYDATPGVLPPKIINVPSASSYGTPTHRTANRETLMREFPDELVESLWLQDWQDIERASQFGRLVDVPSDPDGRGIVLRLEGGSRIGELEDDPYRQALLCRLSKPALGLLYRIAARMKRIEGEDYVPLEITSLVRTWDYQLRLSDVNPNADRTREGVPPTHVLGLAFDIARTQMSYERQQRIEYLFDELTQAGEMAYYKEGSSNGLMHYHVMALPSAETLLVRSFERESRFPELQAADTGERARMPEAPCVTFGSSLEPFSAICSCELPLEVSAQAALADAPISR